MEQKQWQVVSELNLYFKNTPEPQLSDAMG